MNCVNISDLVPLDDSSVGSCADGFCFAPERLPAIMDRAKPMAADAIGVALGDAPPPKCETSVERFDPCASS